jgi:hypothetical protein
MAFNLSALNWAVLFHDQKQLVIPLYVHLPLQQRGYPRSYE